MAPSPLDVVTSFAAIIVIFESANTLSEARAAGAPASVTYVSVQIDHAVAPCRTDSARTALGVCSPFTRCVDV